MGFECCHPAVNFLYFAAVLTATVLFRHPAFLAISYVSAFAYSVKRNGRRAVGLNLLLLLLAAAFALYYWSYHHFGVTVLYHNFIGNSMTLEALLCGAAIGLQVASVVMWVCCLLSVCTTDKVVYLLGSVSPRLSLFLTVLLRMAPRARAQLTKIRTAREGIGRGSRQGTVFRRLLNGAKCLSMLITWLLESLADLSSAMRSRGAALPGRTAFSLYSADSRDRAFVLAFSAALTGVLMAHLLGQTRMVFDPQLLMLPVTPTSAFFWAAYAMLCLLPMAMEVFTQLRFNRQRNQI